MGSHHGDGPKSRRPLFVTAALVVAGAVLAAIAVATGLLQIGKSSQSTPSAEQSAQQRSAQQRCQSDVLKRLVSPSNATLSEVRTETSNLDVDGRDFSSLNSSEPLRGIDISRITVQNVSGVVNAPSEVGSTIQDHFDCRAYFVDGALAHTLVVFDHGH